MSLGGNSLQNLELLNNSTDFGTKGSLLSVMDHCKSSFGRRKLRNWVTRPLVSPEYAPSPSLPPLSPLHPLTHPINTKKKNRAINSRLTAITELLTSSSLHLFRIKDLFKGLPDLERGLVRIHVAKASPIEVLKVLQAFERVGNVFEGLPALEEGKGKGRVESGLLRGVCETLPRVRERVEELL